MGETSRVGAVGATARAGAALGNVSATGAAEDHFLRRFGTAAAACGLLGPTRRFALGDLGLGLALLFQPRQDLEPVPDRDNDRGEHQ